MLGQSAFTELLSRVWAESILEDENWLTYSVSRQGSHPQDREVLMDSNRLKAIIDLHDYLDTIGEDRPPIGVFLKELGIDPKTMSDCVTNITASATMTHPEVAIELVNRLFKLGVTIGYKYAIKKEMERQFPTDDIAPEENED